MGLKKTKYGEWDVKIQTCQEKGLPRASDVKGTPYEEKLETSERKRHPDKQVAPELPTEKDVNRWTGKVCRAAVVKQFGPFSDPLRIWTYASRVSSQG